MAGEEGISRARGRTYIYSIKERSMWTCGDRGRHEKKEWSMYSYYFLSIIITTILLF